MSQLLPRPFAMWQGPRFRQIVKTMLSSRITALLISTAYLTAGIGAWLLLVPDSTTALPHALFFLILILNTYFSIEFFLPIYASTVYQRTLDIALGVSYLFLAASIGRSVLFESIASILFALATTKYILLPSIAHSRPLRRKIRLDALGCALCTVALAGASTGYRSESAWALAVIFAVANVYLLILQRMYQFNDCS